MAVAAVAAAAVAAPPPAVGGPARATNSENELAGFMSKAAAPVAAAPAMDGLRRSKRKTKGAAPRAARVPPSSPEQAAPTLH